MRNLLLVAFSLCCFGAMAQFGTTPTLKKTGNKKPVPVIDSALIYYNMGWDAYKKDSGDADKFANERYGPARYYWEKASIAKGKAMYKNAALYRLGLMQQNGEGVDTNLNAAMDFYKKAAGMPGRLGDKDAIKAIGGFYENGFGVEQNYAKALEWYVKAKQAGNMEVDEDITRMRDRLKKK